MTRCFSAVFLVFYASLSQAYAQTPPDRSAASTQSSAQKSSEAPASASQAPARKAAEQVTAIEYKPPPRGAPVYRGGASTRGVSMVPIVTVLAPDHVGLTTSEQPTLYWYQSARNAVRIELMVVDSSGPRPLIETAYPVVEPGIHSFDLKGFNIRLKADEEYRCVVTLVGGDKARSRDVVSQASFRLAEASTQTRASVAPQPKDDQAVTYASLGIWYDALAALSEGIVASPERRDLRNMRAALLEQVGLKAAAEFDRRTAR